MLASELDYRLLNIHNNQLHGIICLLNWCGLWVEIYFDPLVVPVPCPKIFRCMLLSVCLPNVCWGLKYWFYFTNAVTLLVNMTLSIYAGTMLIKLSILWNLIKIYLFLFTEARRVKGSLLELNLRVIDLRLQLFVHDLYVCRSVSHYNKGYCL